jgi:hypothetical protein
MLVVLVVLHWEFISVLSYFVVCFSEIHSCDIQHFQRVQYLTSAFSTLRVTVKFYFSCNFILFL